jgi:hypothetical protein
MIGPSRPVSRAIQRADPSSKHRISEKFLAELAEHFETNGKAMLVLDAALLESDVVPSPPSAGNPFANTVSKREANDQSDCNCNHRGR